MNETTTLPLDSNAQAHAMLAAPTTGERQGTLAIHDTYTTDVYKSAEVLTQNNVLPPMIPVHMADDTGNAICCGQEVIIEQENDCGNSNCHEEQACSCDRCHQCDKRGVNCECANCTTCEMKPVYCYCQPCDACDAFPAECTCETCTICQQFGRYCFCTKVTITSKIMFENIPTLDHSEWTPRVAPVVLSGELHRVRVFVVAKPEVVIYEAAQRVKTSIANSIVGRVSSNITTRAASASKAVSALSQRIYNKAKFACEPTHEATHTNVKTISTVREMVTSFLSLPTDGEMIALSFDCEAYNLGRDGVTCYLQIRNELTGRMWLVDLLILGQKAWTTTASDGITTLQTIFEDKNIVKLIFDVRGDSDALYNDYGINLAGVLDVQYLAMLARRSYFSNRPNYPTAMRTYWGLTQLEQQDFSKYKQFPYGKQYEKFMERPLDPKLKTYALNDVVYLHRLASRLIGQLTDIGLRNAFGRTQKEINWTREDDYYADHYSTEDDRFARAHTKGEFSRCWKERINHHQTSAWA